MAASIRQQSYNIVNLLKFNKFGVRCELKNTECIVRNKHSKIFTQSSDKTSVSKPNYGETETNANEDFFGIPNDYKLQHARLIEDSERPETLYSREDNDKLHEPAGLSYTADQEDQSRSSSRHLNRRKRAVKANFPTYFGAISFDQAACLKSEGKIDKLALKAQEILVTKSKNVDIHKSNTFEIGDSNSQKSVTEVIFHTTDEIKGQSESQNIFDEQYFGAVDRDPGLDLVNAGTAPIKGNPIKQSYFANQTKPTESEIPSTEISQHEHSGNKASKKEQNNHLDLHNNSMSRSRSSQNENNFFDEQYFNTVLDNDESRSGPINFSEQSENKVFDSRQYSSFQEGSDLSEIDRQYFEASLSSSGVTSGNQSSLGAVAEQYFKSDVSEPRLPSVDNEGASSLDSSSTLQKRDDYGSDSDHIHIDLNTHSSSLKSSHSQMLQNNRAATGDKSRISSATENIVTNDSFLKKQGEQQKAFASKIHTKEPESESAFQYAMSVRQNLQTGQKEKENSDYKIPSAYDTEISGDDGLELVGKHCRFDSKGYRILDLQVPNFDKMTSSDVTRMLKSRIIFNHDDFLAIDKPYGLPSFGQQDDRLSVSGLLPALVSSLPRNFQASELHIVQGLDRDVTGALILAKSPELAQDLKMMYNN
ncbi:hypothetical protein EGW08_017735, partial [Elysia chlorotica]